MAILLPSFWAKLLERQQSSPRGPCDIPAGNFSSHKEGTNSLEIVRVDLDWNLLAVLAKGGEVSFCNRFQDSIGDSRLKTQSLKFNRQDLCVFVTLSDDWWIEGLCHASSSKCHGGRTSSHGKRMEVLANVRVWVIVSWRLVEKRGVVNIHCNWRRHEGLDFQP